MLKASAWPYPAVEDIRFVVEDATFDGRALKIRSSAKGLIIQGQPLREFPNGTLALHARITTTITAVAQQVFGSAQHDGLVCGFRVHCEASKFRRFLTGHENERVRIEIPLEKVRGVVSVTPVFLCLTDSTAVNGVPVVRGSVVGIAPQPAFVTIDETWIGEEIPVRWKPFDQLDGSPVEALMHVHMGGGSEVPEVWLNDRFKDKIEPVITRLGNSPAGLAGAAMREWFWIKAWEKILVWALKNENAENENWPATRIAKLWRERFRRNNWNLPDVEELDGPMLDDLSLRIQHCLSAGENVSRVWDIFRFHPGGDGSQ